MPLSSLPHPCREDLIRAAKMRALDCLDETRLITRDLYECGGDNCARQRPCRSDVEKLMQDINIKELLSQMLTLRLVR